MKIWTPAEEAEQLAKRFEGVSQASFARAHGVPGGASMVSQHIKGRRPLNLAAATAYAAGFGVPLGAISPRLAKEVAATELLTAGAVVVAHPIAASGLHPVVLRLAEFLEPLDETDRAQAQVLLGKLALHPEDAPKWAAKLARLIGDTGARAAKEAAA